MRTLSISLLILLLFQVQLYSQVNGNFQCDIPVNGNGNCNIIPNSNFLLADPNITNSAFGANNVDGWYDAFGSVDINRYISSFDPSINFASMAVGGRLNGEELVVKIPNLIQGHEYLYSFFIASNDFVWTSKTPNVSFSSVLINCQDFPLSESSPYVPITTPNQPIYCEYLGDVGSSPWRQVVVKFTAENNFNMLRIFPSMSAVPNYSSLSFIHFGLPELVDVTPISNFSTGPASIRFCTASFLPRNCSVRNSVFTWKDPNGNILQQGGIQSINLSMPPNLFGLYTLSMSVPSASTTNNTCSINQPIISTTVDIPYNCRCNGGLEIYSPIMGFYGHSGVWITKTLSVCDINNICDGNEYMEFTASSSQSTGNVWEVFTNEYNGNLQISNLSTGQSNNPYGNSQSISLGFVGIQDYGIVKIRLLNTITNTSVTISLRIIPTSGISTVCNSLTYPGYLVMSGFGSNPYTNYFWTFPQGMSLAPTNTVLNVAFDPNSYNGLQPIDVSLQSTNIYGCPNYAQDFTVYTNQPIYCNEFRSRSPKNVMDSVPDSRKLSLTLISPNPVENFLHLRSETSMETISVYSIDGKLLNTKRASNSSYTYYVGNLSKGTYIIKIIYQNNKSESKMFIKN